jgi:hypothetical protein
MIPGLATPLLMFSNQVVYPASRTAARPWADIGSPPTAGIYRVIVGAGVVLSSSGYPNPGMLLDFPAGSTVHLINLGEIAGAGGAGGQGDRGRRDNGEGTSFCGGGGGGGTGRPGGAGGLKCSELDPDDDSTPGSPGTSSTPGAPGVNEFGDIGDAPFTLGTAELVGGDALVVSTAITLVLYNTSGLIVAGGTGGRGGFQTGTLPGGARNPLVGFGPPTGITASSTQWGWAIKNTGGATIVANSGVSSSTVKGNYAGPTAP